MAPQWDWMRERAEGADIMNLFGYTGVGTLLLSEAGARMVHVDASKKSVEAARAVAARFGIGEVAVWEVAAAVSAARLLAPGWPPRAASCGSTRVDPARPLIMS